MSEATQVTIKALTVAADLEALPIIGKYVLEIAATAGLDPRAAYRLRLAVDEIVTNIINYGYGEAGIEGELRFQAKIGAHALTLCLEDDADFFDPTQLAPPDPNQLLEERTIGGWGVPLARQVVDEFRYERTGNCNQNIFVMKRPMVDLE